MANVLDYGADPTGVADSRAAFVAAIAAMATAGGGTVLVPSGVYRLVSTGATTDILTLPGPVSLFGFGRARGGSMGGTVLLADGACRSVVRTTSYRAAIDGLTIDGDYLADYALYVSGPEGRFNNIQARNADYGIYCVDTGTDSTSSRRIDLQNFHIEGCSKTGLLQRGPDWVCSNGRIIPEGSNPEYLVQIFGSSGQYARLHTTASGNALLANFQVNGASNAFTDLYLDTAGNGAPLLDVQAWSNKFMNTYLFWGTGGTPSPRNDAAIRIGTAKSYTQFMTTQFSAASATKPWEYLWKFGNAASATETVIMSAVASVGNTAVWNIAPGSYQFVRDSSGWISSP